MPNAINTVIGTRQFEAQLKDGGKRMLMLHQVPISRLPEYLRIKHDDITRLIFVMKLQDAKRDYFDDLTMESFEALLEAEGELNAPLARYNQAKEARDQRNQLAQMEALKETMPEVYERVMSAVVTQALPAVLGALPKTSSGTLQTSSPAASDGPTSSS